MKFGEVDTVLLPDKPVSLGANVFRVGDLVEVNYHLVIPWQRGLTPHDVHKICEILDISHYRQASPSGLGYEAKVFEILCFARVMTTNRHKCKIEGKFCILARWECISGKWEAELFVGNARQVPLHWLGCLTHLEKPPGFPE